MTSPVPVIISGAAKGGSGKTTVAVNLATCLAERGIRVLLVDLDAQGDATDLLGKLDEDNLLPVEQTTVHLTRGFAANPVDAFGVGLVAWHPEMNSLANMLNQGPILAGFNRGFAATIASYRPQVVLVDIPPAQGIAGSGAHAVATHVITAMKPSASSLKGARTLRQLAPMLGEAFNRSIEMLAVVPIGDANNNISKDVVAAAQKEFGSLMTSAIAHRTVVEEASWHHMPLRQYESMMRAKQPPYARNAPKFTTVGKQFMRVTEEIAARLQLTLAPLADAAAATESTITAAKAEAV